MITDAMIEAAYKIFYSEEFNLRERMFQNCLKNGDDAEKAAEVADWAHGATSSQLLRVEEALSAALAAMWQPIETHRKGEELFLAYEAGHEPDMYECWWNDLMNDWQSDFGSGLDPSHWAPLPNKPEPPK